jgi:membrane protein YqaA with SNARE-associated domain
MKGFINTLVAFGPLGVFFIALIDGIGVPIPGGVDFLLVLLAAKHPDQAYLLAAVTIIGSLIGGMALFHIARKGGESYLAKYTSDGRGQTLKSWFLEYGLLTVFIPALVVIPMPLKISEICAGALGVRPMPFFLTLLAARIPRYIGLAYLGARMGEDGAWPWVKSHGWHMGLFSLALFVVLYLMILVVHRQRNPA